MEESGSASCRNVLLNENEWREVFPMILLGYARVSTNEQDTAAQVSALKSVGCEKIFRDKASGGRWDRPELHCLLDQLRKDDVLVVWRLDRLSKPLRDVLMIMERIQEAKAGFRSLTEAIDTTTAPGRIRTHLISLLHGGGALLIPSLGRTTTTVPTGTSSLDTAPRKKRAIKAQREQQRLHDTPPFKSCLRRTSVIMREIVERSTLYMCAT